jgi:hypothetical protein
MKKNNKTKKKKTKPLHKGINDWYSISKPILNQKTQHIDT